MNPKEYNYSAPPLVCVAPASDKGRTGLTDYAQSQLGDIVYLDLPAQGTQVEQFRKIGEVESVKAVSDIFAPVSGKVLEVNQTAIDKPQLVNEDPYGAGWLVRLELSKPSELDALMDSDKYDKFVAELSEEESE